RRRDGPHGLEIAVAGRGKSGFDHVDPHALQVACDSKLLLARHRGARTLLAVAHRRIEDDQTLFHGLPPSAWPATIVCNSHGPEWIAFARCRSNRGRQLNGMGMKVVFSARGAAAGCPTGRWPGKTRRTWACCNSCARLYDAARALASAGRSLCTP